MYLEINNTYFNKKNGFHRFLCKSNKNLYIFFYFSGPSKGPQEPSQTLRPSTHTCYCIKQLIQSEPTSALPKSARINDIQKKNSMSSINFTTNEIFHSSQSKHAPHIRVNLHAVFSDCERVRV